MVVEQLRAVGVTSPREIREQLKGWDLSKPIYLRRFEAGERLIQYVTNPHAGMPPLRTRTSGAEPLQPASNATRLPTRDPLNPTTGRYFGLPGDQTMGQMGIGSGLAGRTRQEFIVTQPFVALEGTAAPISRSKAVREGHSIRGEGGATQVYISHRDGARPFLQPAT